MCLVPKRAGMCRKAHEKGREQRDVIGNMAMKLKPMDYQWAFWALPMRPSFKNRTSISHLPTTMRALLTRENRLWIRPKKKRSYGPDKKEFW